MWWPIFQWVKALFFIWYYLYITQFLVISARLYTRFTLSVSRFQPPLKISSERPQLPSPLCCIWPLPRFVEGQRMWYQICPMSIMLWSHMNDNTTDTHTDYFIPQFLFNYWPFKAKIFTQGSESSVCHFQPSQIRTHYRTPPSPPPLPTRISCGACANF